MLIVIIEKRENLIDGGERMNKYNWWFVEQRSEDLEYIFGYFLSESNDGFRFWIKNRYIFGVFVVWFNPYRIVKWNELMDKVDKGLISYTEALMLC